MSVSDTIEDQNLDSVLRNTFGFDQFLPGQEDAIKRVLEGQHTLLVLPTGGGKSLCYQYPSLVLDGQTVVISPLISLMQDQIQSLREYGMDVAALNSSMSRSKQNDIIRGFKNNAYDMVYMAPERLRDRRLLNEIEDVPVSLLAIDEAHCISEWGHDFRPDYLRLPEVWNTLGRPTILASTATATPDVRSDIEDKLNLTGGMNEIVTGFNRSNLTFAVEDTSDLNRRRLRLNHWLDRAEVEQAGCAIIYVSTRQRSEDVAGYVNGSTEFDARSYHAGMDKAKRKQYQEQFLGDDIDVMVATNAFGMGIDKADVRLVLHWNMPGNVESYYQEAGRAGRDGDRSFCVLFYERDDIELQEMFIEWNSATKDELERLYDTLKEETEQTDLPGLDREDVVSHDSFNLFRGRDNLDIGVSVGKKLLEEAGLIESLGYRGRTQYLRFRSDDTSKLEAVMDDVHEHRRHREDQLNAMIEYAEMDQCRRQYILDYFGDTAEPKAPLCCDVCDSLTADEETEDNLPSPFGHEEHGPADSGGTKRSDGENDRFTAVVKHVLRAVKSVDQDASITKHTQLLEGTPEHILRDSDLYENSYRGTLPDWYKKTIRTLIHDLIEAGLLDGEHGGSYLDVTQLGRQLLDGVIDRDDVDLASEERPEEPVPESILDGSHAIPNKRTGETETGPSATESDTDATDSGGEGNVDAGELTMDEIVEMGESGDEQHVPTLIEALGSDAYNVRRCAASALGKIADGRAVDPLIDTLGADNPQIRQYTAKALGKIGEEQAISRLGELLNNDPKDYVREACRTAIRNIITRE